MPGSAYIKRRTIRDTFKQMDRTKSKFILVQDDEGKIIGIVTDGDLRRAIWASIPLEERVSKITNRDYVHFPEDYDLEVLRAAFETTNIMQIPIVEDGILKDVVIKEQLKALGATDSRGVIDVPVVIMAGGEGTRLDPFTRVLPKPLIPIGGKPIIEIIMNEFGAFGMKEFTISLYSKARMIQAYFHDHDLGYTIKYVEENMALGTAGALGLLPGPLDSPMIVTNL